VRGISRRSFFVDAPTGRYVLCLYPADLSLSHARYEHALLAALARQPLPFALPTPLPTDSGETLIPIGIDGGFASLCPVIPGQNIEGDDPAHACALGAALGHFHRACAAVDPGPVPPPRRIYGAIDRLLGGTPDPLSAAGSPIDPEDARQLDAMLASLAETAPETCASLPHQIRHGDWHGGNALLLDGRITGILDFEVAGPGQRAMDLAHGWYYLCNRLTGLPHVPWPLVAAFGNGYREVIQPTEAELNAVPLLTRLYFGASMPVALAGWRAGRLDSNRIRARTHQVLTLERFLRDRAAQVVGTLAGSTAGV
jgi:homoserine kinase type II